MQDTHPFATPGLAHALHFTDGESEVSGGTVPTPPRPGPPSTPETEGSGLREPSPPAAYSPWSHVLWPQELFSG